MVALGFGVGPPMLGEGLRKGRWTGRRTGRCRPERDADQPDSEFVPTEGVDLQSTRLPRQLFHMAKFRLCVPPG